MIQSVFQRQLFPDPIVIRSKTLPRPEHFFFLISFKAQKQMVFPTIFFFEQEENSGCFLGA